MSSPLLILAFAGQAVGHAIQHHRPRVLMLVGLITSLFRYPEMRLIGQILAFVIWIAGIVYCDRVAEDQDWNPWVARLIGVLLPIAGPLYYWLRRARSRARHGLTRGNYVR